MYEISYDECSTPDELRQQAQLAHKNANESASEQKRWSDLAFRLRQLADRREAGRWEVPGISAEIGQMVKADVVGVQGMLIQKLDEERGIVALSSATGAPAYFIATNIRVLEQEQAQ